VAEMAATLDCLCDGRLEFGTGRSATRAELEGFGIDPADTRDMWEEALDVVVGAWTSDVFEWQGRHFRGPPRRVHPKPPQKPPPPPRTASAWPGERASGSSRSPSAPRRRSSRVASSSIATA